MEIFNLPPTTKVGRVIPKNAFDSFTTARQKKIFTDVIQRITWVYKISPDTVNLEAKEVKEIQIFRIELKSQTDVDSILEVINKAIPYHILFFITHENKVQLSSSFKHPHPIHSDMSVIDWTFKGQWMEIYKAPINVELERDLDFVFKKLCLHIVNKEHLSRFSFNKVVDIEHRIKSLNNQIQKKKIELKNCNQFNQKVEVNLQIRELENDLRKITEEN